MDMVPTLLGAVAGTLTRDADVLTGSTCGCEMCDVCTDYAKASDDMSLLTASESGGSSI